MATRKAKPKASARHNEALARIEGNALSGARFYYTGLGCDRRDN